MTGCEVALHWESVIWLQRLKTVKAVMDLMGFRPVKRHDFNGLPDLVVLLGQCIDVHIIGCGWQANEL